MDQKFTFKFLSTKKKKFYTSNSHKQKKVRKMKTSRKSNVNLKKYINMKKKKNYNGIQKIMGLLT